MRLDWKAAVLALTLCLVGLAPASPACAGGQVYSLFVGIDIYNDASKHFINDGVKNLDGPLNDVDQIKSVLIDRYGLISDSSHMIDLSRGPVLPTRDNILNSFKTLIVRAAKDPGSVVLFYYAGHGARVEDAVGDHASARTSTILPIDARPPGQFGRDILGPELRGVIAEANRSGVNVLTIFDSCNSQAATRSISNSHARMAPPLRAANLAPHSGGAATWSAGGPDLGIRPGVAIHLAAAESSEGAVEHRYGDGKWRGDFTTALAQTLRRLKVGSDYEDVIRNVQLLMAGDGSDQHPVIDDQRAFSPGPDEPHPIAEGALNTGFLSVDREDLVLFRAVRMGDGYRVLGGTLSDVTVGSFFSVFATSTDAHTGKAAIGSGKITAADEFNATLTPETLIETLKATPAGAGPKEVYLLETTHSFEKRLSVFILAPAGDRYAKVRSRIETRLTASGFVDVKTEPEGADIVLQYDPDKASPGASGEVANGSFRLLSVEGVPRTKRSPWTEVALRSQDPLIESLGRILRYDILLEKAKTATRRSMQLVVSTYCDDKMGTECHPGSSPQRHGEALVCPGRSIRLTVISHAANAKKLAVLDLNSDLGIDQLYPVGRAQVDGHTDEVIGPGASFELSHASTVPGPPTSWPVGMPPSIGETDKETEALIGAERDMIVLIALDEDEDFQPSDWVQPSLTRQIGPKRTADVSIQTIRTLSDCSQLN